MKKKKTRISKVDLERIVEEVSKLTPEQLRFEMLVVRVRQLSQMMSMMQKEIDTLRRRRMK